MYTRRAFSLIELLVVIAVIALLIGLLIPALSRARDSARDTVCRSNMRGVMQADAVFVADHRGHHAENFTDLDLPADNGVVCPVDPKTVAGGADSEWPGYSYAFLHRDLGAHVSANVIDTLPMFQFLSDGFTYRHGLKAGERQNPDPGSDQWLRTWRWKATLDGATVAARGPTSDLDGGWMP